MELEDFMTMFYATSSAVQSGDIAEADISFEDGETSVFITLRKDARDMPPVFNILDDEEE